MKRARLNSLVDIPYNTNDGGAWLKKALDPAELNVDVIGYPDANTNARTVLNYQMQSDIPIPNSQTYVATQVSAYDADLYLYQDPIIFGMSASYPAGTREPISSGSLHFDFYNGRITLPVNSAPRTISLYLNNQIEGNTFQEKLQSLKKYSQRFRMIYGGTQCIPACSDMFDSGTIAATQQIFNPENSFCGNSIDGTMNQPDVPTSLLTGDNPVSTGDVAPNNIRLQSFHTDDFPDGENQIQNPSTLSCRYKEGCYMPYKIKNPFNHPYINAEETTLQHCPYIMSDEVIYVAGMRNGNVVNYHNGRMDFVPEKNYFCVDFTTSVDGASFVGFESVTFYIKCYTKTGIPFWLMVRNIPNSKFQPDVNPNGERDVITTTNSTQSIAFPITINAFETNVFVTPGVYPWGDVSNAPLPRTVGYGIINAVIGRGYDDCWQYLPNRKLLTIDQNIGIVCFRSVAIQAAIKLIFRLGFELMVVSGSVYSPFKRAAPRFDQKALSAYVSAIHNMRDAFYGDAATSGGHGEYSERIMDLVTGNLGTGWYGQVAV